MSFLRIPSYRGQPAIVAGMKAKFIGEFSVVKILEDGNGNDHLCAMQIPWSVMKKIYKQMALFASKHENEQAHAADAEKPCDFCAGVVFFADTDQCPKCGRRTAD